MIEAITQARQRLDAADKHLAEVTAAVFKPGVRIAVDICGRRIIGTVLATGGHWYLGDGDKVAIRNEKTGRIRSFHAGYAAHHNTEILPPKTP